MSAFNYIKKPLEHRELIPSCLYLEYLTSVDTTCFRDKSLLPSLLSKHLLPVTLRQSFFYHRNHLLQWIPLGLKCSYFWLPSMLTIANAQGDPLKEPCYVEDSCLTPVFVPAPKSSCNSLHLAIGQGKDTVLLVSRAIPALGLLRTTWNLYCNYFNVQTLPVLQEYFSLQLVFFPRVLSRKPPCSIIICLKLFSGT